MQPFILCTQMVSFAKSEEAAIFRLEILKRQNWREGERKFAKINLIRSGAGVGPALSCVEIASLPGRAGCQQESIDLPGGGRERHRPALTEAHVAPAREGLASPCQIPPSFQHWLDELSKPPAPELLHHSVTIFSPLCVFPFVSNLHVATIAVFARESGVC